MYRMFFIIYLILISGGVTPPITCGQSSQEIGELVKKADENMEGESSYSLMRMTIIRPTWERTVEFRNWVKGKDYALTLITAPAKEKGQSFLKRGPDMWNYIPGISRMIKLPPSMMSQGWMGSDYTNDDVLNETSLADDFTHTLIKKEILGGLPAWQIQLVPHESAQVVWGKIVVWIQPEDQVFLKVAYYDEDDYLIRTALFSDIKQMGGRRVPTRYEINPADEPGQKTIVEIMDMQFNIDVTDDFFSQQNMKRIR